MARIPSCCFFSQRSTSVPDGHRNSRAFLFLYTSQRIQNSFPWLPSNLLKLCSTLGDKGEDWGLLQRSHTGEFEAPFCDDLYKWVLQTSLDDAVLMPFYFSIFMPINMLIFTSRVKCVLLNLRVKGSFIKPAPQTSLCPSPFFSNLEALGGCGLLEKGKAAEP